jgi:hypothetical protein
MGEVRSGLRDSGTRLMWWKVSVHRLSRQTACEEKDTIVSLIIFFCGPRVIERIDTIFSQFLLWTPACVSRSRLSFK